MAGLFIDIIFCLERRKNYDGGGGGGGVEGGNGK